MFNKCQPDKRARKRYPPSVLRSGMPPRLAGKPDSDAMGVCWWDRSAVLALNGYFAHAPAASRVYDLVASNNLVRGLPIFLALLCIWFGSQDYIDRAKIVFGLLAACAATAFSVLLQKLELFHLRPFIELTSKIYLPHPPIAAALYSHPGSWPSDTATMYSAVCTIVFFCRPKIGVLVFCWSLVVIDLPRAAFGYHYPSDILSGIGIGVLAVWLAMRAQHTPLIDKARLLLRTHEALSSSLLALFLAEMMYLFASVREIASIGFRLLGVF